jgi:hypothetical protein
MTGIRMEDPYGEFKRVEISLNNFSKSIQNNMKRFGFFPDSHKKLFEKSCQISDSKRKADMSQESKEHLLRLFENMWLNELFLYQTEKILGNDYLHFFFQEYISFYYSLFTGISIISRILYPNEKKQTHIGKIRHFNNDIKRVRILKDLFFPPFIYVVDKNGIDIEGTRICCSNTGIRRLSKWIGIEQLESQTKLPGVEPTVQIDAESLKFCRSLLKYFINDKRCDCASFVNYFMKCRHFFHYKVSSIFEGHYYNVKGMIEKNRNNMRDILKILNFEVELFYSKKSDSSDLISRRDMFVDRIVRNSPSSKNDFTFLLERTSYLE